MIANQKNRDDKAGFAAKMGWLRRAIPTRGFSLGAAAP
jgi:hypothetical protein